MNVFAEVLIAIAVIVVVARLVGLLAARVGQPRVMGEIAAGILLGPSVLGAISPEAQDWLFPDEILGSLNTIAQLGLIFFLFLVGLELEPALMRRSGKTVAYVLPLSLGTPFLLGVLIGLATHDELAPDLPRTGYVLFLGVALAITAFPVLARLLSEKGLLRTPVGTIALTCAALEDICAWIILAVVVAVVRAGDAADTLLTILYTVIFAAVMLFLVRPALAWVIDRWSGSGRPAGLGAGLLTLILVGVLMSAWITEEIGIHAIFGAFLFGAILPRRSELVSEVTLKLEDFTLLLFLPVFFAITGLRTELSAIDSWTVAAIGLVVLAAAIVGKFVAGALGALASGMPGRDSAVLGLLMNTRGLTELVIITIGAELGVVPESLFAILVLMALITTLMAAPLIDLVYRPPAPVFRPSQSGLAPGGGPRRILVALDGSAGDPALVNLAQRLAEPTGAAVTLARVLPEPERLSRRTSTFSAERAEELATARLAEMVEGVTATGTRASAVVETVHDVGLGVCRVAEREQSDLVLVGFHRTLLNRDVLGGPVATLLEKCPADIAVFVNQSGEPVSLERGQTVLAALGGGDHETAAAQLADRLAAASGVPLVIVARDEAAAAVVREQLGETEVVMAGEDPRASLASAMSSAGVLVLGAGDDWSLQPQGLGEARVRLLQGLVRPALVVRHGPGSGQSASLDGWLQRARRSQFGDWLGSRSGTIAPAPEPTTSPVP